MFCPKCGSILVPKKENNKKILVCSCGHKDAKTENAKITEEVQDDTKPVEIIDKETVETLPLTKADCPKCGHDQAYYWLVQTRSGDEPETKFLRCEKCKHTWRDYS